MSGSATTIYMCYGNIRGEAEVPANIPTAPAGGGWMKLTGCSLSAAIGYGQQFTMQAAGSADATPVQVTKLTDASSTGLFRESLLGMSPESAVIIFMRTGQDAPQEYMRIELEQCGIMDFAIEGDGEDRATEKFAIIFHRLSVITWEFDDDGQAMGQAMASIQHIS